MKEEEKGSEPLHTEALGDVQTNDWGNVNPDEEKAENFRQDPAFMGDKEFFRMVARFLGWAIILGVLGSIGLAAFKMPIPEGVIAVSSAAIGALAGVLTVGKTGGS